MKRVLTALLLIPTFLYLILWAPYWVFLITVAGVGVLCFREYADLASLNQIEKPGIFGYVAGLLILFLPDKDPAFFVLVALLAMALALRSRDLTEVLPSAAALLLGILYVFGTLAVRDRTEVA